MKLLEIIRLSLLKGIGATLIVASIWAISYFSSKINPVLGIFVLVSLIMTTIFFSQEI